MINNYIKCPVCDLNYMLQSEKHCKVCDPKTRDKFNAISKMGTAYEIKQEKRLEAYGAKKEEKALFYAYRYNKPAKY